MVFQAPNYYSCDDEQITPLSNSFFFYKIQMMANLV